MLDRVARTAEARDALLTFAQARADIAADAGENASLATLLGWVENYLMREHPDLGDGCPRHRRVGHDHRHGARRRWPPAGAARVDRGDRRAEGPV